MSDSDIGKTLPFAQTIRTSPTSAASIASKTGGRSFEEGVGRNWLSMITATLALPSRSSAKRGPSNGAARASRAAFATSATGSGSCGYTAATRLAVGISSWSVSRCFLDSSSVAPIARGSIDSNGITARYVSLMGPPMVADVVPRLGAPGGYRQASVLTDFRPSSQWTRHEPTACATLSEHRARSPVGQSWAKNRLSLICVESPPAGW